LHELIAAQIGWRSLMDEETVPAIVEDTAITAQHK
jgi:hypothetical protein